MEHALLGLIPLLATGLALAWGASVWLVIHRITHPPRKTYASAVARGRPGDPSELDSPRAFTSWTLDTNSTSLPVWDIVGGDPDGPIVVMTHGWGDSRVGALVRLDAVTSFASRVIAWDMPGHGEAPGVSRLGTREPALLRTLIDRVAERGERVVLCGWSLGAGVSIVEAAGDERIAAVIVEAPYRFAPVPARNVIRALHLPHRLNLPPAYWILGTCFGLGPTWRGFDRSEHAARLRCPLLVLHGELDEICPLQDSRDVVDAARTAPAKLVEIEGAGHNNLWLEAEFRGRCIAAIAVFMQAALPSPHTTPETSGQGVRARSTPVAE